VTTPVPSAEATWTDLCERQHVSAEHLDLTDFDQWTITYRPDRATKLRVRAAHAVASHVLAGQPLLSGTWHRTATARAGLHYLTSMDRLQSYASWFERNTLMALDFARPTTVASQPFQLSWTSDGHTQKHIPDFAANIDGQVWVIDCRPAPRVDDKLLRDAAATARLCGLKGWRFALITGYRQPAHTTVTTLASTRQAADPQGYAKRMLDRLADGDAVWADLVNDCPAPAVARGVLQRLGWERAVSVDLSLHLDDDTVVSAGWV
jgi:hypothetical protein